MLFVRLFGLCLFGFVGFLFLLGSGKGCGLFSYLFYGLPSNFTLLETPPTKVEWKGLLNHRIHEAVETHWKSDIQSKSSTKYLNSNVLKVGSCHHIWHTVRNSVRDNIKAQLKCRLLTGTYTLQANMAAFNHTAKVGPDPKMSDVVVYFIL